MPTTYAPAALRAFRRDRLTSSLNVAGLAVALACSFLVMLWVSNEVRYDRFHERGDRLYQVMRHIPVTDDVWTWASTQAPVADVLGTEFPAIERVALTSKPTTVTVASGEDAFEEMGHYADPAFFEMFSFPFVVGDPSAALASPTSVVVSERLAAKLFGTDWQAQNVVGRAVTLGDDRRATVTGVFADVPAHSSIQFDLAMPVAYAIAQDASKSTWNQSWAHVYVELREGADPDALAPLIAGIEDANRDDFEIGSTLFLKPIEDLRLYGSYSGGELIGGRIEYVRLFSVVALFLLVIAAVNFTNLATAQAGRRTREVGVRKTLGAARAALTAQFLGEAVSLALVALAVAVVGVAALLPAFGALTGVPVTLGSIDGGLWAGALAAAIGTGLLAGAYPALYLSGFRPATALRGTVRRGPGASRVRGGLVVLQFALSTLLVVGALTVYQQIEYVRGQHLGVDRAQVVSLPLADDVGRQFDAFRAEIEGRPGIESVTRATGSLLDVSGATDAVSWPGSPDEDRPVFTPVSADVGVVETMGLEVVAGRAFSRALGDSANVLVNERAVEVMGLDDPVGTPVDIQGFSGQIVGVVRDFHTASMYEEITPTLIRATPQFASRLYVRTEAGRAGDALASLEAAVARFAPDAPFDYTFLDDEFEAMYRAEAVMGTLAALFAIVALFVACLGLLGLASFTAEQRRKEVGVRKVLGATVAGLVALLSRQFAALVAVAFAVGAPVAYVVLSRWLEGFAYRVDLGLGVFAVAGLGLLALALSVVGAQALRAATADPVRALRSE